MSIKVNELHSHLDFFPHNLGGFSEEQGELFHQNINVMEDRKQGRWNIHMMADSCSYERQTKRQKQKTINQEEFFVSLIIKMSFFHSNFKTRGDIYLKSVNKVLS